MMTRAGRLQMLSLLPARFPSSSRAKPGTNRYSVLRFPRNMSTSTDAAASGDPGQPALDSGGAGPDRENREAPADVLVQYVVLRRDLIDTWPLGSIVSQGCHASVAAVWSHRDHPDTAAYCSASNLDSMHKVTLELKGEVQMRNLSEKLGAAGIDHKLWVEQPEDIPTCIATRPYPRSRVASFFKKLKLCK